MGVCATKEAKEAMAKSRKLEEANQQHYREMNKFVKLLLLGAGESGKSTIFKQMKLIYGAGFSEKDRAEQLPTVLMNLISGAKTILEAMPKLKFDPVVACTEEEKCAEGMGNPVEAAKFIEDFVLEGIDLKKLGPQLHQAIYTLWNNEKFHWAWENRSEMQLFDAWHKFAKAASKSYKDDSNPWGKEDWVPGVDDVLNARVRTSGIVEDNFEINGVPLKMFDVGGQRNERKKWIHCFEDVQAIIFCGAISEYDQVLFEDVSQNRLLEAITLFAQIANNRFFLFTAMILFLNKRDLFEVKFLEKHIPMNIAEYPGGKKMFPDAPVYQEDQSTEQNYSNAKQWILEQFMKGLDEDPNQAQKKAVYSHFTCATDTENIKFVLNTCADIILKKNMGGSGFS